jgi:sialate O-acetylesterase
MKKPRISLRDAKTIVRLVSSLGINLVFITNLFSQSSAIQLAPLFQDNMVLQQQRSVPIWGKGIPGTQVLIKTSWGKNVSTVVNPDSSWVASLLTPKAGGPFQISIRHGNNVTVVRNILVGEVWLCSGQSNMEMPLEGWPPSDTIANSAGEIDQALYPTIRMFSVMHAYVPAPTEMCIGNWTECSPRDVRGFSATAYYFGKILSKELKVPIGLINSSFGGTSIEAWMSKQGLNPFREFADQLKKLDESQESVRSLNEWVSSHKSITVTEQDPLRKWEGLNFQDEKCSGRVYNDSDWNEMKLPTFWEQTSVGEFDGVVWFRKEVVIPKPWIGKELTLQLGPIDDLDETYVNGQMVGRHMTEGFWSTNRVYQIAAPIVQDSLLQIAVRVIDLRGGGGIWGKGMKMKVAPDSLSDGVSLEGNWKYLPVAEFKANTFYVFGAEGREYNRRPKFPLEFSQATITSLFNGMIHPLLPFTIKGVIWYQGENNVSNPLLYKKLFPAMIDDWRKVFQSGEFPFYFVQLAPYDYGRDSKSQLLREAQCEALSVKNTGMAVTLDIGNPKNIHPADKEDVGKRLALWALAKTYKKNVPYSGPIYKSMKIAKSKIILSFDYAGNGLVLKGRNGELNFLVAGLDKVFKKAVVRVQGNTLVVSHPEILEPLAVRYAWSNIEEGTFFNKEGLPASSFRTDDWRD